MASINKVLDRVNRARPNACDAAVKAEWLIELDNRLYAELQKHIGVEPPKAFPEDGDKLMTVPEGYDNLYDLYLYAMLDLLERDTTSYQNNMAVYNQALDEWRKQYNRTHMPVSKGSWKL